MYHATLWSEIKFVQKDVTEFIEFAEICLYICRYKVQLQIEVTVQQIVLQLDLFCEHPVRNSPCWVTSSFVWKQQYHLTFKTDV
jgi:hypothetical protein